MSNTLTLSERLYLLARLGAFLRESMPPDHALIGQAGQRNPWFTPENVHKSLTRIGEDMLHADRLHAWTSQYHLPENPTHSRKVGLVMAGNLPLVGFHDWLAVFLSGHQALVKLSEKDAVLLPFLLDWLTELDNRVSGTTVWVDRLQDFEAVIATGSNNASRYFAHYFAPYPHIIRRNRNGVAVLHGHETAAELDALTDDIFDYFGMGCRSVSKVWVPEDYDFVPLIEATQRWDHLFAFDRYRNNYDYQCALLLLNQQPFLQAPALLIREDAALISPISTLHYQTYTDVSALYRQLRDLREEWQCIVSARAVGDLPVIPPGSSQRPGLQDYPDGVDTMAFLCELDR